MNPVTVIRQVADSEGTREGARAYFWCPGCDDLHGVGIPGDDGSQAPVQWEFNGDLERPTVSPSILVNGTQWDESSSFHKPRHKVGTGETTVCHSFLRGGRWEFLGDCTHALKGQTADMVPLPDWMLRDG